MRRDAISGLKQAGIMLVNALAAYEYF